MAQIKKQRNQSIELLRILLMTLIVFGHILLFGIGVSRYNTDGTPTAIGYLSPLYLFHVDAFVFISGYYGIKLKWNRFITLLIKMVIYSMIAIGLCYVFFDSTITSRDFVKNLYPISTCDWWFMSQYLYLMLMSPFINYGVDNLSRKQLTLLVLAMYILSFRGFSCLLVFIYMLARYLRNYPFVFLEKNAGKIFIASIFTFFCLNLYFLHIHTQPEKLYGYMSPFNVVAAAAIFYVFKRINIKWKRIGTIASGVLAAYLVTTHEIMQVPFNKAILNIFGDNVFVLLGGAFLVVLVFSLIDNVLSSILNKHLLSRMTK